ncbi:hypothetical protein V6R21_08905 [Limibacter armeniacum]|uniref:hypothetical protein n=1 Tax=Limibacter armeniacum TaxID=466084 RepID=UPI002FE50997
MNFTSLKGTVYPLLFLVFISACTNSQSAQEANNIKSFQMLPQNNDTTYFELEKNILVSQKNSFHVQMQDRETLSVSKWKLIKADSLYTFELIDIRYLIPTPIVSFLFDTEMDSVPLLSQLPGEIGFGQKTKRKQELALEKLKQIKGFKFSIIHNDSYYFYPSFDLPLKKITVENEYDPAASIQMHLDADDLLAIFGKMLSRPSEPFVLDSLYKQSDESFIGRRFSELNLNYTFQKDNSFTQVKNTFNEKHQLIRSGYSEKSTSSKDLNTSLNKNGKIYITRKVDAQIQFRPALLQTSYDIQAQQ